MNTNRMHIAVNVESIKESEQFYTKLLGHEPTKIAEDQIDWVIDDPATHFSIYSDDKQAYGLEHIGIDFKNEDLKKAQERLETEASVLLDPNGVKVELYTRDPQKMQDPYKTGLVVNLR